MLLGIHLTLLIGPTLPVPAPAALAEALIGVEVTHADEGRSGFELTFQVGRSGLSDLVDYPLLANPLVRPFNRVIVIVTFNAVPRVLMDGFVTRQQLSPSNEPGRSTFALTGEDVSVMMDLNSLKLPHPAQDEARRVQAILARYQPLLLLPPTVIPPRAIDVPSPEQEIPTQPGTTDLAYLTSLARRSGHVFYVTPGPLTGQNQAYWGPPVRLGIPQSALSVNMGPSTNVDQISFRYDPMAATTVLDVVQDSDTNLPVPVAAPVSTRLPPLAAMPSPLANLPNVRVSTLADAQPQEDAAEPDCRGGLTAQRAFGQAQAKVDKSVDRVVSANGELDALRYGDVLTPRALVGVRGVGFTNDGNYYVKSVTHSIRKGEYKQRFTLTREGVGALTPLVRP